MQTRNIRVKLRDGEMGAYLLLGRRDETITIAGDGTVSYMQPGQTVATKAGQIQIANFQNPAGLNSLGHNLYQPTDATGAATLGTPGGQAKITTCATDVAGTIAMPAARASAATSINAETPPCLVALGCATSTAPAFASSTSVTSPFPSASPRP